mgnify:CR=1 FL=1
MLGKAAALAALTLMVANGWANAEPASQNRRLITEFTPQVIERILDKLEVEFEGEDGFYTWTDGDLEYSVSIIEDMDGENSELFMSASMAVDDDYSEACHDWNVQSRFGRMYHSEDMIYFEHDLIARGGVTEASVERQIEKFQTHATDAMDWVMGMGL